MIKAKYLHTLGYNMIFKHIAESIKGYLAIA